VRRLRGTLPTGAIVTPTAKNPETRGSRFTGLVKGCLFFVTFFGASKESKTKIIYFSKSMVKNIIKNS